MVDEITNSYTQGLMDTLMALSKEVANSRIAYDMIHRQIEALNAQLDKANGDAVKEAIDVEELAKLAVVSAEAAHKAALILLSAAAIKKTQDSLGATQKTYESAKASTSANKARQAAGRVAKR